jgi:hypothetical protein
VRPGARAPDEPLLDFAQKNFDVFVTVDRKLVRQTGLSQLLLGVVIVAVPNNRLESFEAVYEDLRATVANIRTGEVVIVRHPRMRRVEP